MGKFPLNNLLRKLGQLLCHYSLLLPIASFILLVMASKLVTAFTGSFSLVNLETGTFLYTVANTLPILVVLSFIFLLTNNLSLSLAWGFFLVLLFACINIGKLELLSSYLVPSDFLTTRLVLELIPEFWQELRFFLILTVLGLIGALVVSIWLTYKSQILTGGITNWRHRLAFFLISFSLLEYMMFPDLVGAEKYLPKELYSYRPYSKVHEYKSRGVPFGFFYDWHRLFDAQKSMDGYDQASIQTIIATSDPKESANTPNKTAADCDVILYLMEAFSDPLMLADFGVKIEPDPIPFFRGLAKKHTSGSISVPTFGGLTAKTEFEILTGLSMEYTNEIPYFNQIYRSLPALPTELKKVGYQTFAVHPYKRWFWNRASIYTFLGIDTFIAEESFKGAQRAGRYIADKELISRIISLADESDHPKFIFGITMSTHGPHDRMDEKHEFTITGPADFLNHPDFKYFKNYLGLIHRADKEFAQLIEHFQKRKKKTMIVAFGDHLPSIPRVYKSLGFWDEQDPKQLRRIFSTPLLIWTNFPSKREDIHTSANYIPEIILGKLNLLDAAEPHYRFLASLRQEFPIFSSRFKLDRTAKYHLTEQTMTEQQRDLLRQYRLLNFDILLGKQYSGLIERKK